MCGWRTILHYENLKIKPYPLVYFFFLSLYSLTGTEVFLRVQAVSTARRPGVLSSDNLPGTATYTYLVQRMSFILIPE